MTGWPSVSVVIPTRGKPLELRQALASVLDQAYPGSIACVVVFDGAEPFDLSDAEPSDDNRSLVVTRNTGMRGIVGARNAGVSASFGDLVAFCGEANEWLPGKLAAQVEALHAAPGSDVVVAGIERWKDGAMALRVPSAIALSERDLCRSGLEDLDIDTVLVTREALEETIGPFDASAPDEYAAAYGWLLTAARLGPLVVVRDPLVRLSPNEGDGARSEITAEGLTHLLAHHPSVRSGRASLSRMEGSVALDLAASGRRADARRWALRSIGHRPKESRAYRALLVSVGLVDPAPAGRGPVGKGRSA